jgi:hypothetical protein
MNKLTFEYDTNESYTQAEVDKINQIFTALISTGGLLGMKNGSTSIHFDKNGDFQAIRLDYTPWRRFTDHA